MKASNNIQRIPRPKGLTYLASNPTQDTTKQKIRLILIHYINNNYTVCNQHYNLHQLAQSLNVSYIYIQQELIRLTNQLGKLFGSHFKSEEFRSGLAERLLFSASTDRGLIHQHVSLLLSSQGDGYKPFISSEVTKGLQTLLASNKQMADIVKMLMPSGPTNNTLILNQGPQGLGSDPTNPNQGLEGTNYLTIGAATALIQGLDHIVLGTQKQLIDGQHIQGLGAHPIAIPDDITDLPEIDARHPNNAKRHDVRRELDEGFEIIPGDD